MNELKKNTVAPSASGLTFAEEIVSRAIMYGADDAHVNHESSERFELEADTHRVNLLRTTIDESTNILLIVDGKTGSANFNGRDVQQIDESIEAALAAARAGIADAGNCIADVESQPSGWHGPESADREAMMDAVNDHLACLAANYPQILTERAIYAFSDTQYFFANSNDVRQQERRGAYKFRTTFGAKQGRLSTSFNSAGASSFKPFDRLIDVSTFRRSMEELLQSFEPQTVPDKFVGDVILSPGCMASFMATLSQALGGYALISETTPYRDSFGEQIASTEFTLQNRPRYEDFPLAGDFDGFGVPTQDTDVIKNGRLKNFLIDFYCAQKLGREQTAGMLNLMVAAGNQSIDELIANTERGILFNRFSGGQPANNLEFSGVAKNSFYIENGRIKYPLIETMVSGNIKELFLNIRGTSKEVINNGGSQYPFLAASGVTISGK